MEEIIKIDDINEMLLDIRGKRVLLDSDVAKIYGIETKRINEAVKNNLEKFPLDYMFELENVEFEKLRSKISTTNINMIRTIPKVFTEKGLYMLATILKSKKAVNATFLIIETFAKVKELQHNISDLYKIQDKSKQEEIVEKSSNLFLDIFDDKNLDLNDSETSFEINLAVLKFKHKIHKKK